MARNRTIELTGNESKSISVEDSYDSCVLRKIEARIKLTIVRAS